MAKRSRLPVALLGGLCALLLCGGLYFLFHDLTPPEISVTPSGGFVAGSLPIAATMTDPSGIKSFSAKVKRGEEFIPLADAVFTENKESVQVSFSLEAAKLPDGEYTVLLEARDDSPASFGRGNLAERSLTYRLDTTPPVISVKTSIPYARKGGTVAVVYTVSKEVRQTGVVVDKLFFPAFKQPNGDFLCFFAFPYNMESSVFQPKLAAVDTAGNSRITDLPVNRMNRDFKHDTLNISQGFLDGKAAEFHNMVPGSMLEIDRFLKVNGEIRRANAATLLEIGKDTSPEILWNGAFLRLPRSASRAGFADHRTYMWEGKAVDEQTHLGFDLASTAQAEVPAANAGRVVFAGYLGIYGNLVVVDHGLGLQSLYSHLSSISVKQGDILKKGDILGRTGATGMAGGDHLHFGILIAGLEVTPLEWLDPHWIKDNVTTRVKEAGGVAPEIRASDLAADAPAPVPNPAAKPKPKPAAKPKPKPARR